MWRYLPGHPPVFQVSTSMLNNTHTEVPMSPWRRIKTHTTVCPTCRVALSASVLTLLCVPSCWINWVNHMSVKNNASTQMHRIAPSVKHIPHILFFEVHASFFSTLTYIKTVQWHIHGIRDKYLYLFMGCCWVFKCFGQQIIQLLDL